MGIGEKGICVRILEKEFRVACTKEQEKALCEAAEYLDRHMRAIRHNGRVIGIDRIAVMAALNIANDLLKQKQAAQQANEAFSERIQLLQEVIDQALMPQQENIELEIV